MCLLHHQLSWLDLVCLYSLEALGLKDDSGVIYELINYRYLGLMRTLFGISIHSLTFRFFTNNELGDWDKMIDGLVNVRK